ncbi:MAG TPA: LamG-like jellyroll fold domain-containing protein [Solirubrobacteraceae bacterium]|nr:LamG-like jellyroll fold domain-containing protein [Solirubrobacteraceae bacterium]
MRKAWATRTAAAMVALAIAGPGSAVAQGPPYPDAILATPGLDGYWRLGEASGTAAADASGRAGAGSYAGAPGLGARGAVRADDDTAARFDGVDDEVQVSGAPSATAATLEGWFFWEAGVALLRDATGSAGWILAYDSGGKVAYRVGGSTFTSSLATASVRDGWHHVAVTVDGTATRLYVDGAAVHSGTVTSAPAPALPWHVMRNGTIAQFTRGRADEIAVYATALDAATVRAHFEAGRDTSDASPPPVPSGLVATARLGRVELAWSPVEDADLDGYDVLRATGPTGPFTRVNASRLSSPAFTDSSVAGGTTYFYAVTASDIANNRSGQSAPVSATPPSNNDLLRRYSPQLRYEPQESYFADSAAEMTDNFVAGKRQNVLVGSGGTRIAAADPADPLPTLSLGFLGDPAYASGRTASTADFLDAANGYYQQDAQRLRAAGYGDRIYGRAVTAAGKTWLQYWLFSYYNPQNVLGYGVHEGDWEFIQVGLDGDGAPDVATYGQHAGGESCAWSRVQKTPAGAPVVYVALASHASYFSAGVNGRGLLPDDYHRGGGYLVSPALEIVSASTPFMAWAGKWGASSSSPVAPRRQGKWGAPNSFDAGADTCTVGATQASATALAQNAATEVPAPRLVASRAGADATIRYRFAALGSDRGRRPTTLLVTVTRAGAPDVTVARRVRVRGRSGTVSLRLPPAEGGPYVAGASAFSQHGARSRIARARIR